MTFLVKMPLMTAIIGLSVGLVGCGGDNSNANYNGNNGGNSAVTLKYNIFNREYATRTSTIDNLTRTEFAFANTGLVESTKGLLKPYTPKPSQGYDYEIGDHYFEQKLDTGLGSLKNMQVTKPASDRYQVAYQTMGENGKSTAHSMTLKEIDISGTYDFAKKEAQGFHSWVNNSRFKKLPAVLTFPTGSSCFVFEQLIQDKVTFGFEQANMTNDTNLDTYVSKQYGVIVSSIKKYNVGLNNESQVVEFKTSNSDSTSYAVLYNGKVYENAYKNELVETENSDITKGEVDCEVLNTTAADYMEQQLIKAYK